MKAVANMAGGETVVLDPGDSLDRVPESHRDMATPALCRVFADPVSHFRQVAANSKIPALTEWLAALVAEGKWKLMLHEGYMMERSTLAAFFWRSATVRSAMISLPEDSPSSRLPSALRHYYSLVDVVHWDSFGCAGGLLGSQQHIPLAAFSIRPRMKGFDPDKCVVWGNSGCGDMLIYTTDDKAGFLSHENLKVNRLGTIHEALEWVFQQLLENRTPEFDFAKG